MTAETSIRVNPGHFNGALSYVNGPRRDHAIKIVYLRCMGGEVGDCNALVAKVAPLGLSARTLCYDIARATAEWKGMKVTCKLTVFNRQAKIEVVPSAASLITRELNDHEKLPRGHKRRHTSHNSNMIRAQTSTNTHSTCTAHTASATNTATSSTSVSPLTAAATALATANAGDIALDQVVAIARTMRPRSMAKKLEGTVKEILGTCQSVGCTVNGMHPHDIIEKIRAGQLHIPYE